MIAREKLLPPQSKVLVAVSGGVDSMVLLHLLHSLAKSHGWQLEAAHYNHQLRGQASAADARFVRTVCKSLGIHCHLGKGAVRSVARRNQISIEMAARQLRHQFLAQTAQKRGLKIIALAHHADDQLETLFLRLGRGMGGESLGGMTLKAVSPADPQVQIIRPLLHERRSDIEAFAREVKIQFREDASNRDSTFLRNRVRHELLPAIKRCFGTQFASPMLQSMEVTAAEADFVEASAGEWLGVGRRERGKRGRVGFEALHPAVQRQVIRRQLLAAEVVPTFQLIERLRLHPDERVSVGSKFVSRASKTGQITFPPPHKVAFRAEESFVRLRLSAESPLRFAFGGVSFVCEIKSGKGVFRPPSQRAFHEWFDADKVGPRVVLRHWRAGDRFQPIGMKQSVKLQDLFVNARIPASQRRELTVAVTGEGTIFWVEGLRMGEAFKLTPVTRRRLEWRWERFGGDSGKQL